jgi:hypothetical protein
VGKSPILRGLARCKQATPTTAVALGIYMIPQAVNNAINFVLARSM